MQLKKIALGLLVIIMCSSVLADTFQDLYDDPFKIQDSKKEVELKASSQLIAVTNVPHKIDWLIGKTGLEQEINVDYTNINKTTTQFCLNVPSSSILKDISLPITKIALDFEIKEQNIRLSTEKSCFYINYAEDIATNDVTFKIGTGTIYINSTVGAGVLFPTATDKIVYFEYDNKNIIAVVYDYDDGAAIGNVVSISENNGATWRTIIVNVFGYDSSGVVANSTGGLFVYYTAGSNINFVTFQYNSTTVGSNKVAMDITNSLVQPSCAIDSKDIIHCCAIDTTSDLLYYTNSTIWNTEITVNANTTDDSDYCDIEIGANDCVYIVTSGTDMDKLTIYSPCLNGWGYSNRIDIYDDTAEGDTTLTISNDNKFFVVDSRQNGVPIIANSSDGRTWNASQNNQILNGGNSQDVAFATNGQVYLLQSAFVQNAGNYSVNSGIYMSNKSIYGGTTWSNVFLTDQYNPDNKGYVSIAQSTWPKANNLTFDLRFVYDYDNGTSQFIVYSNVSIMARPVITDSTPPSYSNIGVSNTNPSILDNVIFSSYWTDDVALDKFIYSWNATGLSCDTWANDTAAAFSSGWANVTKQIPATCAGKITSIGWQVFANDTSGNKNNMPITMSFSSIVASDLCAPPTIGTFNVTQWCNFTSTYQIPGDINCSSTGIMNISGTLNFTGTNQKFILMPGCKRWMMPTGRWGKFQ